MSDRAGARRAAGDGGAAPTADAATGAGAIVFTDIVGFTELTELHGDDAALDLVERQIALVGAVMRPSGRIVKEIGDGLLLWFDEPAEALCAALDLQDGLATSGSPDDLPLWVRIGAHWGVPRRRGDDIIGRDVNLASRVTDLAGPGEVLCTGALVTAIGGPRAIRGVRVEFAGATFVKGLADPLAVHVVSRG